MVSDAGVLKKKGRPYTGERINRVPVAIIIIHHNRSRGMFYPPELLHDFFDEVLEPRCTVRSGYVKMVLMSRDLSHKRVENIIFLVA